MTAERRGMARLGDYGRTVTHFVPSVPAPSPYVPADHVHIWQEWGGGYGADMTTWQQCRCGARTDALVTPNPFIAPVGRRPARWRRLLARVGSGGGPS